MKSDLIDKLLIILLVVILPASIFSASKIEEKEKIRTEEKLRQEQLAKVDEVIKKIEQKTETDSMASLTSAIEIKEVVYASKSGELSIKGKAPEKKLNVMISTIITPPNSNNTKQASSSAFNQVLGQEVAVNAVKTNNDGEFEFVKKINKKEVDIIELRFDQNQSSATVQYDVSKNKRIL